MKTSLLLILTILSFGYAFSQAPCQAYFSYQSNPGSTVVSLQGYAYSPDSLPMNVTSWTWTISNAFTLSGQNVTFQANSTGTYYICLNIQTDLGCSTSYCDTVTIGCSNPCNMYITGDITNATTDTSFDGSIDITVQGGSNPLVYTWSNGMASEDLYNISAGSYDVTVTDAAGCVASQYFYVSSPDTMPQDSTLQIWATTYNTSGPGQCDGFAYISVYGGTAPYQYIFANSAQSSDNIANLCVGTYTVVVVDANGLSATTTFTVSSNFNPGDSLLYVNISSGYSPNGSTCMAYAEANAWGGVAPYTYLWDNGAASQTIQGLCAGFYCLTVTDASGQNASACVSIMNNDSTFVYPQDTTVSSIDTCFTTMTIDSAFVAGVNTTNSGVYVNWVLLVNGDTIYVDQQYVISTPGSYLITLIINCNGAKSILSLSDVYVVTPEDLTITGINKFENNASLSLYPNPVQDILNIYSSKAIANVSIIDATGRMISTTNSNNINTSNLANGIYIVKVNFIDNSIITKKIIK